MKYNGVGLYTPEVAQWWRNSRYVCGEFKSPIWAENIADVGGRVPIWHKKLELALCFEQAG